MIFNEKWMDISMTIEESMKVYKNKVEKKPVLTERANHESHAHHESSLSMDLHTGTHVDMPLHMIKNGKTSDDFDLDSVNGEALLIDFSSSDVEAITEDLLSAYPIREKDILLLKTKNSCAEHFEFDFAYLEKSGAEFLARKKIKAVGIDALGIERDQNGHPTHKILMHEDITIIEGLNLKAVEAGRYTLLCLPLKIKSVEGLPARCLVKRIGG